MSKGGINDAHDRVHVRNGYFCCCLWDVLVIDRCTSVYNLFN